MKISRVSFAEKWSMLIGNAFEQYDSALFSFLSPFLAPLFFPNQSVLTALILTYCIIPLGMIARPVGSLFFGYIGDTLGRREALIFSLIGMAVVTGLMAFLPTYDQVGILAPVILSLGRILQNFFGSGEAVGGAIYLIEDAEEERKNLLSSFFNASTMAGILLASFAVSSLCLFDCVQEWWRLLYIIGCATAIVAYFLRRKGGGITSPPVQHQRHFFSVSSMLKTCWSQCYPLITIAIISGFSYSCYSVALVMINAFVPQVSALTNHQMMQLNTILLIIDFLIMPFFGILATKFSKDKIMLYAAFTTVLTGLPLFYFLESASFLTIVLIRFIFVIIGVAFSAPFHAWAQEQVPPSCRYTVVSFAYAIGCQIFGAPTAAISLWFFQKTNWIACAGIYWVFLAFLASLLLAKQEFFAYERKEIKI